LVNNIGTRIRCSKCGKPFYDLGKNTKVCPKCKEAALIPDGAAAQVRMDIQRGRYNDFENGWTGGLASKNDGGSVFLKCKFEVIDGKYKGQQFSSLIGLFSPKGPWWGNEGRKTLRQILNSANGLSDEDYSLSAIEFRRVDGLEAFDGLEFVAEIERKKGTDGVVRNEFKRAVGPDDPEYAEIHVKPAPANSESTINQPTETPIWLARVQG
jgi:phage FluMu protein Com